MRDVEAWLPEIHPTSEMDLNHDSAMQIIRDILMQSTRVIIDMARGIQGSIVQLFPVSNSENASTISSTMATSPWPTNRPFSARDIPSLQKYALLFPVWAALSSQQMLMEAQMREILPKVLPEGENIRQRVEWLTGVMKYIKCEFRGIDSNVDPEGLIETPQQASDFARIQGWLDESGDGGDLAGSRGGQSDVCSEYFSYNAKVGLLV